MTRGDGARRPLHHADAPRDFRDEALLRSGKDTDGANLKVAQLLYQTARDAGTWRTDGFIISADRYSVYDPAARKTPPNDIDDEVGRVGRGLHLEAEWDTASSDPFEKAGEEIDKKLAANPANKAELEADKAKLEGMKKAILKDVESAVLLMKEKMIAAGLEPDDRKLPKEERASEFMADQNRAVNWL